MSDNSRLLTQFIPTSYNLKIDLTKPNHQFNGQIEIIGESLNEQSIILNSRNLKIKSVILNDKVADFSAKGDFLFIDKKSSFTGNTNLKIIYSGVITDVMHGIYPCYYQLEGKREELIATQFESHYAREAFPCIDEPGAKATYNLTLITKPKMMVLGNMTIKNQFESDDSLTTVFNQTPKMSSYLLAFVVGNLQHQETETSDGIKIGVWSTKAHSLASLDFATTIAKQSIEFYESYFNVKYPLKKSDQVALPDFSAGAMENWGLITYRESALLADPASTTISNKRYIATVIAHELSHQWFGDLVTMEWWNDLWLNESFATLMEYLCVDRLYPKWNLWLNFSANESYAALSRDALSGVQPVRTDIKSPEEIDSLFDGAIVYAKGAKLIKMILAYIGEIDFRKGLTSYFNKYMYKNTTADDLWNELEKSSRKDIRSLIDVWLNQSGYPVLSASLTKNQDEIKLNQKQFFINHNENSHRIWPILLKASTSGYPEILNSENLSTKYNKTISPLIFNNNDESHFIVKYDESLMAAIEQAITNNSLSNVNKLVLLNSQTLLARAGQVSYASFIDLILTFKHETNEFVWRMIVASLGELRKFVEDNDSAKLNLKKLYYKVAETEYSRLGWTKEKTDTEDDVNLRTTILGMMVYSENEAVLSKAKSIFEKNKDDLSKIDPEIRSIVLAAVVKQNHSQTITSGLINVYQTTSSSDLKDDICAAITSTTRKDDVSLILDNFTKANVIKPQDLVFWFVGMLRNTIARDATWEWLTTNWKWIEMIFKDDMIYSDFPRYSANILSSNQQLKNYENFFGAMINDQALRREITVGIDEIKSRIELINNNKAAVANKLETITKNFDC